MTNYKLTYFNVRGLGEPIRIMLSYMGKDFEDKRITHEDWPELKKKSVFGKLPMLEIDGKEVCQSYAICKYLAVEAGLTGKNDWENLQIDMVMGSVMDLHFEIVSFFREQDPKKKEELKNKLLNELVPLYYGRYEDRVKKNGYLANNSLSWVDIFFASYSECADGLLGVKTLDNYKHLQELKDKLYNIPNIKKWIQKRPDTR